MPESSYIDSNIFIYAATDKGIKGHKARNILVELASQKKKTATCTLTIDEFLWVMEKKHNKIFAAKAADIFFTHPTLSLISVDTEIISEALQVYIKDNLAPRDSIHLAAMRMKGITNIYSNDKNFDHIHTITRKAI